MCCIPPSLLWAKEGRVAGFFKQLHLTNDTSWSLRKECVLECTNTGKQQKRSRYGQKLADLLLECKGGRGKKPRIKRLGVIRSKCVYGKGIAFSSLMCIFSSGLVFDTFFHHPLFYYRSFSLTFGWLSILLLPICKIRGSCLVHY